MLWGGVCRGDGSVGEDESSRTSASRGRGRESGPKARPRSTPAQKSRRQSVGLKITHGAFEEGEGLMHSRRSTSQSRREVGGSRGASKC